MHVKLQFYKLSIRLIRNLHCFNKSKRQTREIMYGRCLYLVLNTKLLTLELPKWPRAQNLNLSKSCSYYVEFLGPSELFVYLKNIIGVIKKDLDMHFLSDHNTYILCKIN